MSENNSIISKTVSSVSSVFLKQESKINEKLDSILQKKLEKLDSDENKYTEVLKFNILFYKTIIRNTEPLIGKWIENKSIPDIEFLEEDIELIAEKCRKYINKIREEGIENLKDIDLNSFNAYDKIKGEDKIKRLERDYKVLNVYKDLLNITLRKISMDKHKNLSLLSKNPIDIKRELKRELIMHVNKILSNSEKDYSEKDYSEKDYSEEDFQQKDLQENISNETNTTENIDKGKKDINKLYTDVSSNDKRTKLNLEEEFLKIVEALNYELFVEMFETEYKKLCALEELLYSEGMGFGQGAILEFATASVLLRFVNKKQRNIIEGAMRLVIIGEFGEQNFKDAMVYIVNKKLDMRIETWYKGLSIIENRYQRIKIYDIASRKVSKSKEIDIDEYIYMIENADPEECFRNIMKSNIEKEIKVIDEETEEHKPQNTNKKKKKVFVGAMVFLILLGAFGAGYTAIVAREKHAKIEEKKQEDAKKLADKEVSAKKNEKDSTNKEEQANKDKEAMIQSKIDEMESYKDGKGVYYTVYAGSHKLRENAEETLAKYNEKGIEGSIVEANKHFRIKIGEYPDYNSAKAMCKELAKKSVETYVKEGDKYYECKIDLFAEQGKELEKSELEVEYYSLREELKEQSKNEEYVEKLDGVYDSILNEIGNSQEN